MNTNKNNEKKEDEVKNPLPQKFIKTYKLEGFKDILNLPVVHATWIFPEGGKMMAGKCVSYKNKDTAKIERREILKGACGWRPTLHWGIGELPLDIKENTLSNRPYIIITTLEQLLPQLIGLNYDDTFILGDFMIPDKSYIIVRSVNQESFNSHKKNNSIDKNSLLEKNKWLKEVNGNYTTLDSFLEKEFYENSDKHDTIMKVFKKFDKEIFNVKELFNQVSMKDICFLCGQEKTYTPDYSSFNQTLDISHLNDDLFENKNETISFGGQESLKRQKKQKEENEVKYKTRNEVSKPILKKLAGIIPKVQSIQHDAHEIGVIEKLKNYVCVNKYSNSKDSMINTICEKAINLEKFLSNHYKENLNKDRKDLYDSFVKKDNIFDNALNENTEWSKQEEYIKSFIKNNDYKEEFKILFSKVMYFKNNLFKTEMEIVPGLSIPYLTITSSLHDWYGTNVNCNQATTTNELDNNKSDN